MRALRAAGSGQRACRDQVVERDHLGLYEAALEVGVDDADRLRRGRPGPDLPGPDLPGPDLLRAAVRKVCKPSARNPARAS